MFPNLICNSRAKIPSHGRHIVVHSKGICNGMCIALDMCNGFVTEFKSCSWAFSYVVYRVTLLMSYSGALITVLTGVSLWNVKHLDKMQRKSYSGFILVDLKTFITHKMTKLAKHHGLQKIAYKSATNKSSRIFFFKNGEMSACHKVKILVGSV